MKSDSTVRRFAFSLIELLIAIAIVAVLAALGFGALAKARNASKMAQCLSNLRQIGSGVNAHLADHNRRIFPDRWFNERVYTWESAMHKALGQEVRWAPTGGDPQGGILRAMICPADESRGGWQGTDTPHGIPGDADPNTAGIGLKSYLPNRLVLNRHISEISQLSRTIIFAEYSWAALGTVAIYPQGANWYNRYPAWHGKAINVLFLDGHVESLDANSLKWPNELARLWQADYPNSGADYQ